MRLSKHQKLDLSAIDKWAMGLCSVFGHWKKKKFRCFVNAIEQLQMRAAFTAAFTSEKQ